MSKVIEDTIGKPSPARNIILIADDDDGILNVTKNIIQKLGYTVITASNGYDAIEKYKANEPHLVLMDLRMPGMDGTEAFFKIREINPNAKIILMSAYGLIPTINDAFDHGLLDFIEKPVPIKTLREFLVKYG